MSNKKLPLIADGGFSSVKGVHGSGCCRLKTAYREDRLYGEDFNGQKLVAGETALMCSGSQYLMDINDLINYYPFFVSRVARYFSITCAPLLAVGLPYQFWLEETIKGNEGKENMIESLICKLRTFTVGVQDYSFEKVIVLPQGLGATMAFLAQNPGTVGDTLSIDIGFNTVIITLYSISQRRIVYGATFYNRGVSDMTENYLLPAIAKYIKDKTYSPAELNQILENGTLQVGFKSIEIFEEIKKCADEYAFKILQHVIKTVRIKQGAISFKNISISGGGARLLGGLNLVREDLNVSIAENPEMQNALGFDLIAREALGQANAQAE